jgi:hypothetical protein
MILNGYRSKTELEPTEYQKRIEAMDTVILCVAEAEKMVMEIGRNVEGYPAVSEEPSAAPAIRRPIWTDRRNFFKWQD